MTKYHAVPTTLDGIRFDSKAEAARYATLKRMQAVGAIRDLEIKPKFPCEVGGRKVCTYIADFGYITDKDGRVIEDVKGVKTAIYRLKKKLVEALHGVQIVEVAA